MNGDGEYEYEEIPLERVSRSTFSEKKGPARESGWGQKITLASLIAKLASSKFSGF